MNAVLNFVGALVSTKVAKTIAGKFVDVTTSAGIRDHGMGLSATWFDYDDDGYPDLYVANDFFGADHLYRNNGDGTFSDVIAGLMLGWSWWAVATVVLVERRRPGPPA